MVLAPLSSSASEGSVDARVLKAVMSSTSLLKKKGHDVKRKYKRQRIPETEKELKSLRAERQAEYERILEKQDSPSIWSFESLFPQSVWDEQSIKRDLYEIRDRDNKLAADQQAVEPKVQPIAREASKIRRGILGGSSMMRIWREPKFDVASTPLGPKQVESVATYWPNATRQGSADAGKASGLAAMVKAVELTVKQVDVDMTRLVEDRIYGYRRTPKGTYEYDTSLMGDGAVKFRDGVRLGKALKVNADRLNYLAKKELQHGRVEEAQELYERAIEIDPRDGRAYLGLSRCAQRRRDFKLARECLKAGLANAKSLSDEDQGGNPFLLQALGCLEERTGRLSQAEAWYVAAVRARPWHAAGWVSLAQLRTRKLRQPANSGRQCFQAAERELKKAGMPPSAYVYTAWAAMEHKKAGDTRRARELFKAALDADPKCSAAWLQLGVMEAENQNWKDAQDCFETILRFDQRNSRALQAYALMEIKRPKGSSRKAIDLFERALNANPRDAGVLQAYALYVVDLGDIDAARKLLRRGTEVNKRHAPVWQAWGVLETRHGTADTARDIFQQGIWACAQLSGGQSGGCRCARLWQAWGVLEARENDPAAARRCFSRALDADGRNVAAFTAWALMEEKLGNLQDARAIFERALSNFAAGSDEKVSLWRSYELMEQRLGNVNSVQQVYERSMRETFTIDDETVDTSGSNTDSRGAKIPEPERPDKKREVEVLRWDGGGEVWLNDNAIEARVPFNMKQRRRRRQ